MSVTRYRKGILSVPSIYTQSLGSLSGTLLMSYGGAGRIAFTSGGMYIYKDLFLGTGQKFLDASGNTLLDPDDAGGITTLANVANSPTFNSIAVQQPFLKGVANKQFVPLIDLGDINNTGVQWTTEIIGRHLEVAAANSLAFMLALPTNAYGLKLYVKNLRVILNDADASNYITAAVVYGAHLGALTALNNSTTDKTAVEIVEYSFSAADASAEQYVFVVLALTCATILDLEHNGVLLECYYDA